MATTSPDNLKTPDAGDQYALVQDLGAFADTVQIALNNRGNLFKGPSSSRVAFTSAPDGARWQDTNGDLLEWVRLAGAWRLDAWHTTVSIPVSSSAGGTVSVALPTGAFATNPTVQVSRASSGLAKYIPYSNNPTASSVTVGVFSGDGSSGSGTALVSVSVFRK